ncbi:MAG TPA: hypothetical protein VGC81_05375 [Candidatus Methylomirabilis sp.]|jgi:hypothetical protein
MRNLRRLTVQDAPGAATLPANTIEKTFRILLAIPNGNLGV